MAITPECNPAAEVQGPGPNIGDGNPFDVNVLTLPPVVIPGCVKVEDCPTGTPVRTNIVASISLPVNDNGGSLTVDGSVAVTNFPASQAVTIADGADVCEGATTDPANVTGAVGTTSGKLRGMVTILANVWDSAGGMLQVRGKKSTNAAAPTGDNLGVLSAVANASAQGITEGRQCLLSVDLSGNTRVLLNPFDSSVSQGQPQNANRGIISSIASYPQLFDGFFFWNERTPSTYKTVQAVAAGNTILWTPTAGRKFRLMRYMVEVTGNASIAGAGAVVTISLFDGLAGPTGQSHDVFVPLAALAGIGLFTSGWIDMGNGYISALTNNVLNVNLSAALVTGNVRVVCCGTEEV